MQTIRTLAIRAHEPTLELDLELLDQDLTLEEARGGAGGEDPDDDAARALRRARSLHASGALRRSVIGCDAARVRFEACLARAERSAAHAPAAVWLRARFARDEHRLEDAIRELKRALHLTRDRAATRAIYGELADLHAAIGEHGEAVYYARRAGRLAGAGDRAPTHAVRPRPPS